MGLGVTSSSAHNLWRVLIVLIAESKARYRENPLSAAGPSTGVCGTALRKMIQNSLALSRRSVEPRKKEAIEEPLALVARRLAMVFFYLPVIILEAWMLSPPKRRTDEPDALA